MQSVIEKDIKQAQNLDGGTKGDTRELLVHSCPGVSNSSSLQSSLKTCKWGTNPTERKKSLTVPRREMLTFSKIPLALGVEGWLNLQIAYKTRDEDIPFYFK